MSDEILNAIIPDAEFDSPFDEDINFKTVTSPTEGGKEYRYQKWLYPRRSWKILADARNNTEINRLWKFYLQRRGSHDTFLFENPNDSPVYGKTGQYDVFCTGDGAERHFYLGTHQLVIPTGDVVLVSGSVVLQRSVGGTGDFASFTAFTYTPEIGKILTNTALPSGDVLRGDYRFMYRARFSNDKLSRRAFAYQLYSSELEIVQVI